MTDRELWIVTGALLHDVGKIVYRGGDTRKHSVSGLEYLREEAGIDNQDILDCVKYHHADALTSAKIAVDSPAYIVYIADNMAAASDRRQGDGNEQGFQQGLPLESVFNILNGNQEKKHYHPAAMEENDSINMPTDKDITFDQGFYGQIQFQIKDTLKGIDTWNREYIHSLLSTMEAYLSYIPSSTAVHELSDISLFDHVKLTAAYSSCLSQYLEEQGITNYREALYKNANAFYETKAFRLFSMDLSGIQSFIYTIHSEGALRMLRSRSFYLELLVEHLIDELLEEANLTRANLIYSGGGHCYILLPNTKKICELLKAYEEKTTDWFLGKFDIALYGAMDSVSCSAKDLANSPDGSYSELFLSLGRKLSAKKASRYTAEQLMRLNALRKETATRECRVCKTSSHVDEEGICSLCGKLKDFSADILYKGFFTVYEGDEDGLPLPGEKVLRAQEEKAVRDSMKGNPHFVRTYGKNRFYTGKDVATKLWVGDYTQKNKTTDDYAEDAQGIDRIGVLRGDVDNLGKAFISGFSSRYATLSRTATFSRQLSMFFKYHMNRILAKGEFSLTGKAGERKATIVYSGGDDFFVIGAWNDVIELAVDIEEKLKEYSQNTLSLSAGIGIYPPHYPLSVCAEEVESLEKLSKSFPEKDALTIFGDTYHWQVFVDKVAGEKLQALQTFFRTSDERGKAFLYRLMTLVRNREERINLARFAYLLARLSPSDDKNEEQARAYQSFSKKMYEWIQSEEDSRQLVTAMSIHIYLMREGGEKE